MTRRVITPSTSLSEQHALNAIAYGVAGLRTTDYFTNDGKGSTLALTDTNASKAVPASARGIVFWCAADFRWRFNTAADLTDGAYGVANSVYAVSIDPDDDAKPVTLQAILSIGSATLFINFIFGS